MAAGSLLQWPTGVMAKLSLSRQNFLYHDKNFSFSASGIFSIINEVAHQRTIIFEQFSVINENAILWQWGLMTFAHFTFQAMHMHLESFQCE